MQTRTGKKRSMIAAFELAARHVDRQVGDEGRRLALLDRCRPGNSPVGSKLSAVEPISSPETRAPEIAAAARTAVRC